MLPETVGINSQYARCCNPVSKHFPGTITQQLRDVIETIGPCNQNHYGPRIELCGTCRGVTRIRGKGTFAAT